MESPFPKVTFDSIQPEDCDLEKPPIIFLHGVSEKYGASRRYSFASRRYSFASRRYSFASSEYWIDIPTNVANVTKRKVFVVDLRNRDGSLLHYVNDVLQFMDTITVPKAIFVGHGLGGLIAMRIAWMANERVEKIAVEDVPVTMIEPFTFKVLLLYISLNQSAIRQLPKGLDEYSAKQFIADYVHNGYPPELRKLIDKPTEANHFNGILKPTGYGRYTLEANMDAIRKGVLEMNMAQTKPIGVYDGPTCFIYGKESPFHVDKDEDNIKKHFPNAELVGIENTTHFVHMDSPQKFTEALLKFI